MKYAAERKQKSEHDLGRQNHGVLVFQHARRVVIPIHYSKTNITSEHLIAILCNPYLMDELNVV
jgi:hypothetical protein